MSAAENTTGQSIAIARIDKPLGLSGKVALAVFGATLGSLKPPCTVMAGRDPETVQPLVLKTIERSPKGFAAVFEGYEDRTLAEKLRGKLLYVAQTNLPELKKGTYYHYQLKGMQVVLDEGARVVGTVTDVMEYPTTDALQVRREDGSTILVPFVADIIVAVDTANGKIVISGSSLEELL